MPTPPRGSLLDDRAQVFPLLNFSDLKRAAEGESTSKSKLALARHLRDSLRAEVRRHSWVYAVIALVIFYGLPAAWFPVHSRNPALSAFGLPIYILFWVLFSLLFRAWIRAKAARQLAATAVAEGICGSCAYSLEGAIPDPDGCVRCPECGAAWKHDRIVRPHWNRTEAVKLFLPPWYRRFLLSIPSARDLLAPDDRGRFVRFLDSRLRLLPPDRRAAMGDAELKRVTRIIRAPGRPFRILVSLIPGAITGAMLVGLVILLARARLQTEEYFAAALLGGFSFVPLGGTLAVLFGGMFAGPRWTGPELLKLGLCACCGRGLRDLPVAEDGCRLCPECGSAWKLDADVRP